MKCIIYGLSTCRQQVELYLKDSVTIVGYSDSFSNLESYNGKKFYKPNELLNLEFDKIIIAINKVVDCVEVEQNLRKLGINNDKIISLYKFLKYIYKLKNNDNLIDTALANEKSKLEGMVLGLSYGCMGIVPKYLDLSCYNFSRGSQDLYYSLIQLKYIKNKYKHKISDLKYVILDMYTYTYFNYDVSLSKNAFDFIYYNGFEKYPHNLKKNINYSNELIEKITSKLTKQEEITFDSIFKKEYIVRKDIRYYFNKEEINNVLDEEEIKRYSINSLGYSSIQKNIYTKTERENIEIFENILKEILDIDLNIKIYLVLIPRYKLKEDKMEQVELKWKYRFYNILNQTSKKYEFEILDFKNNQEISNIRENYSDLEHLNYNGAIKFTKLLSLYIK
ncbi:hypothetical protein QOZ84_03915 [Romboutsia sedimentorum]|uniref:SGNH/GDSL hydrolase family protein n=1 Tax=Romboutsia sedimentorum TaxID=1368474 RepID=A0ABT7E6X8_9FIRM|nr:hypothetical protein [Romboutsia sedimentorum]MDK2562685.1 hypothetical protein [Romboutsia sedimentorum]